ncbi:hypothetical protein ACHWQZ_G014124 [Mnemiopsis leidyi]
MFPTPCDWLLRQNNLLKFRNTLPVLDQLVGGLHSGQIIELCGPSGIGKSQVCWHLIRDCLNAGKNVAMISSKKIQDNDLENLPNPDNLSISYVSSVYELLLSLAAVASMTVSLVVIDGIQPLLQAVLGSANFKGQALLNEVKCGMGTVSVRCLVIYTNGLVSVGDGNHGPALGRGWEIAPSVRIMMLRDREGERVLWRNREVTARLEIRDQNVEISWN